MEMGLTHKDLAKALGVSETTIKSYRRKFPACIPVTSNGKPIRFAAEAETVCRRIQELFALGMAVDDVRVRLSEEFLWIEPALLEDDTKAVANTEQVPTEQKKALLDEAALLKEALQQSVQNPLVPTSHTTGSTGPNASTEQNSVSEKKSCDIPKNITDHKTATETGPRSTPYTTLSPEVRTAISDMARTVVELTLQQKKLLKQVEGLESRLDTALETIASMQENAADISSQSLCSKTPIHEQIQMNNAQIDVSTSQEASLPEEGQGKTRNPLLKIFGLERHG